MRILILILILTGCASGDWADENYGPGDWLNDNTPLTVVTMSNYQHLVDPTIRIHRVDSVASYCDTVWAQGCAVLKGDHCDIYVGKVSSRDLIAHEERHWRGWTHYRPRYDMFTAMGPEFRARELQRASLWFPKEETGSKLAKR